MTSRGGPIGLYPYHELGFWEWWSDGIVRAGVRTQDLPAVGFPAEIGGDRRTTGEFRVHYDAALGQIYTTVKVRADLCSPTRIRYPGTSVSPDLADFLALVLSGARVPTSGVVGLALQCAHFEQFAWRFWERTNSPAAADRAANRRAAWLVGRWQEEAPRYRPPGFSRGVKPVHYAALRWRVEGGVLLGESAPD